MEYPSRVIRTITGRAGRIVAFGTIAALVAACGTSQNASSGIKAKKPIHMSALPTSHSRGQKTTQVVNVPANLPTSALTQDQITAMLNAHNTERQQYNQPALTWSADLASYAQDWANQIAASGNFSHRPNNAYGENIFFGSNDSFSPQDVVNDWDSESQFFDTTSNTCPDYNQCGHFTQVVWSTTTSVGCGKASSTDGNGNITGVYWVCNYDPAGNLTNGTDNSVKPF